MSAAPLPILVLSGHVEPGSETAAAALAAGALEALPKCSLDLLEPGGAGATEFRRRLTMLSRDPGDPPSSRAAAGAGGPRFGSRPARADRHLLVDGRARTPSRTARRTPAAFPIPILIAQHMTTGFADGLARWLDSSVPLPVHVACAGEPVTPRRLARARRHAPAARPGRRARPATGRPADPQRARRATSCCAASRRPSGATRSRSSSPAWAATAPRAPRP